MNKDSRISELEALLAEKEAARAQAQEWLDKFQGYVADRDLEILRLRGQLAGEQRVRWEIAYDGQEAPFKTKELADRSIAWCRRVDPSAHIVKVIEIRRVNGGGGNIDVCGHGNYERGCVFCAYRLGQEDERRDIAKLVRDLSEMADIVSVPWPLAKALIAKIADDIERGQEPNQENS